MNLDLLKRHSATGELIIEWAKAGKYRIVKYDLPPDDMPWFLVRVGLFGFVYGVPGSDRGCPGEYNYQLTNANNPIALLDALAEVAKQKLNPQRVKRRGRDKLPKTRIVDEIDINATVRAILTNARQETPIQDLCKLIRRPKLVEVPGSC